MTFETSTDPSFDIQSFVDNYNSLIRPAPYDSLCAQKYIASIGGWYSNKAEMTKSKTTIKPRLGSFWVGGLACIHPGDWDNVLVKISEDIEMERHCFWNEISTGDQPIRFTYELDIKRPKGMGPLSLEKIMSVIWECNAIISKYCPHADLGFIVLDRPAKPKKSSDGEFIVSQGLHVIYQNLAVSIERGRQISYHLNTVFPDDIEVDSIFNTRDARLRMPYSLKRPDNCPVCNNSDEKAICDTCKKTGKVICPYVYKPMARFNRVQEQIDIPISIIETLRLCSINTPSVAFDMYAVPETAPLIEEFKPRSNGKIVSKPKPYEGIGMAVTKESHLNTIKNIVRNFKAKEGLYSKINIKNPRKKNNIIMVGVSGEGQSSCGIKGEPHRGNHIWFHIDLTRNCVSQRCYDTACKKQFKNADVKDSVTEKISVMALGDLVSEYVRPKRSMLKKRTAGFAFDTTPNMQDRKRPNYLQQIIADRERKY